MPTLVSRRQDPRRTSLRRPTGRVLRALLAVVAVLVGLAVAAAPATADPTAPSNPSDAQIGAAQASKTQLAAQVGALTAQLSQLKVRLEQLIGSAQFAEQQYAYAIQKLGDAKTAASQAKQQVATAQAQVVTAQNAFNASIRAQYTQGEVTGGGGALLTTQDPSQLLQSAAFQAYITGHQADGIGRLARAKVAKANADAAARSAVATQTQRTADAQQKYTAARAAQTAAEQEKASVASQQAGVQSKLETAQAALLGLQDQRAKFVAWQEEQARIAAAQAAARAAAALAAQQAAAAQLAAQQAAQQNQNNGGGGGGGGGTPSGGGGGGGGGGSTGNPSGGSWTAARGQDAVNRAMQYLGMPYAFAGGNYNGPTNGVCQSGAAWNDCNVYGFDCSGLVLYAWAPYLHMDHFAATQYTQAGSYHPDTGSLMPGDLLFYGWSQSSIHHVAMYVGNGNVIQAPQSGDHVRITSIWNMGSDYYGATRPLT